jgi:two-component system, NtrC family, nitrogen regulation sensor histidine kinase NtrY
VKTNDLFTGTMKMYRPTWHLLLISTFLSVAITAVYLLSMSNRCDTISVTETVKSVTAHRYNLLTEQTAAMQDHLTKFGTPDLLSFNFDKFDHSDISLFLLQEGRMIFWTDNRVPWDGNLAPGSDTFPTVIRLQNGWYLAHARNYLQYNIVGFSLIKHHYPYSNEYLTNTFHPEFPIRIHPEIILDSSDHKIYDAEGIYLFSLDFTNVQWQQGSEGNIAFFLFLISFILVNLVLLHLHRRLNPFSGLPDLALLAFALDAIIVRGLIHYFRFPSAIHNAGFFNPQHYASSWINPSFGDLILNSVTLLIIAWSLMQYGRFNHFKRPMILREILPGILLIAAVVLIAGYVYIIKSLIFDSTLSFDFNQLLSADLYSITGLVMMVLISVSMMMLTDRIFLFVFSHPAGRTQQLLLGIFIALIMAGRAFWTSHPQGWITALMFTGFLFSYVLASWRRFKGLNLNIMLFIVLAASLTWMLNTYSVEKEKSYRLMVAADYAQKDDPMAEFLFGQAVESMYQDTLLARMIFHEEAEEEHVINYILQNYFQGGENFWAKYYFQVTVCTPDHRLVIENRNTVVACYEFFQEQIQEYGTMTMVPDFILIHDHLGQVNYLGVLRYDYYGRESAESVRIFIELFPKVVPVDVGYLELLVDQSVKEKAGLARYTNARYANGQLVASYGKYNYSISLKHYLDTPDDYYFFSKGGYSHLFYRTGPDTVLLISRPESGLFGLIAPFSLFLLVFLLVFLLSNVVGDRLIWKERRRRVRSHFKYRLQLALFSVIVISFVVVGGTSVYYISMLNHNKNMDNLREKARSIRIEVEHKLADKEILDEELKPYIQQILTKFNDVFATDINLFDTEGNLLGSSRMRIFDEGLINSKMNTEAYREMAIYQKTLLIHEEQIGGLNYLSAYIPFKNNRGNIIAYINLPYFARQSELKDEISSFMMAFINIYLLLIGITILYAFFISDMIAKPLIIIREKIRRTKLGAFNEKIDWEGYDEIGELINEYNRMVDELGRSAELLARSERESAWREMARQVAHEIKNPLTPMKLNLQHLEKTLHDDPQRWKQQFDKFARTMHEQIESLSTIASAFSDFANMPRGKKQALPLGQAVKKVLELFSGYPDVDWEQNILVDDLAMVFCDPEQLNRMMINLLNNALQSGIKGRGLHIAVKTYRDGGNYRIEVTDNGKGISEDIMEKIFLPSFTTKSSGMGLGLAIARSIAEGMGGDITFTTAKDKGTTFIVTIPVFEG